MLEVTRPARLRYPPKLALTKVNPDADSLASTLDFKILKLAVVIMSLLR